MTATKAMLMLTGLTVGCYWARVLAMAHKARRRTGRAANILPPEPLGRALRIIWFPTVAAWIVAPFLAATNAHPAVLFMPLYRRPGLQVSGALVVFVAFILTLMCWRSMGKAWRMGIDPSEKNPLVTTGPFSVVRHPIYALSTVMMLGTLVVTGSLLAMVTAVLHIALLQWESRREEQHMLLLYGAEYATYCASVGRWVPRLGTVIGWCS